MMFSRIVHVELCALAAVFSALRGGYGGEYNVLLHGAVLLVLITWMLAFYSGEVVLRNAASGVFPFAFYGIFLFVSVSFSVSPHESLKDALLYLDGVLLFFILTTLPQAAWRVKSFFFVLGAASAALSLYALFHLLVTFPELPSHPLARFVSIGIPQRVFSTFIHPNVFGSYLVLCCFCILGCLQTTRAPAVRFLLLFFLSLNGIALLFTYSFGVIAVFLCMLAAHFFLSRRRLRASVMVSSALLISFILFTAITRRPGDDGARLKEDVRQLTDIRTKKSSMGGRFRFWKTAAAIAADYPVTGSGLRTFKFVGPGYQRDPAYSVYPHQMYLQTFAEAGAGGVFGLLWVFIFLSMKMAGLMPGRGRDGDKPFMQCGLFILVYVCLHGFLDFEWNIPLFPVLVFSISGMLIGCSAPGKAVSPPETRARFPRWLKAAGIIFCIALAACFLKNVRLFLSLQRLEKANVFMLAREFNRAQRVIENEGAVLKNNGMYHGMLSRIFESRGDGARALRHIQKAIQLEPYSVAFLGQGARLDQQNGLYPEAEKKLQKALKLCPFCVDYRYGLALIAMKKKNKREAEAVLLDMDKRFPQYERVQNVPPVYLLVFLSLGDFYQSGGDTSRALLYYRKALKYFPKNQDAERRLK